MTARIAAIGECMLELSAAGLPESDGRTLRLAFGGDTLNTAVYLARLGVASSYVTALGDDAHSEWMLGCWRDEGVDTSMVHRVPGRVPGLYMIDTDADGERYFSYWRGEAPARELFDDPQRVAKLEEQLAGVSTVYLSGITLSLYSPAAREHLFAMLQRLRGRGARVGFDGNYRPAGWPARDQAREAFTRACAVADIVLPTFEDEQLLFGDRAPGDTLERIAAPEIVLKQGASGCLVASQGEAEIVPALPVAKPVDTTAAGDSFNAAYLAARSRDLPATSAARWGHALAATVIQHRGAIIAPEHMPDLASFPR